MDDKKGPVLVDDATFRKLSEHVAEQKRANDIEEKKVAAMWRREANVQQVLERYADLGERVTGLVNSFEEQTGQLVSIIKELILTIHGQKERDDEKARQIDRVEDRILIILGALAGKKNGEPIKLEELSLSKSETKELLRLHQRRLRELKKKKALLGQNSEPELLTEIEDIEAEIARLQKHL